MNPEQVERLIAALEDIGVRLGWLVQAVDESGDGISDALDVLTGVRRFRILDDEVRMPTRGLPKIEEEE